MAQGESIDEYVSPEEPKLDPLVEIYLNIQKQIDVFSDLAPPVVMAINNALAYSKKLEEYRTIRTDKAGIAHVVGPDPSVRIAKWIEQYLRLRASVSRKSRRELSDIFGMEKARTISRISIDGNQPGENQRLR